VYFPGLSITAVQVELEDLEMSQVIDNVDTDDDDIVWYSMTQT
jgi:hypothetical protein